MIPLIIQTNVKASDLPEIKSDYVQGATELLSIPEVCRLLNATNPLPTEPETIACYFQLLHQLVQKRREERVQQHVLQKDSASQRLFLWSHEVTQIQQILQFELTLSWLGNHLLCFLCDHKPFCVWQKGWLVLLSILLYPYTYFRRSNILCQPQKNRTQQENTFLEQQNQIIHDQLKLLEEQLAPLPKPIERRVITGQEVFQIIRDKFPDGDIHLGDSWHEGVYSLCDIEDIEALLDVDETNHLKYVKSKFDCENFAALLWGQFNTPDWAPFAIGYMWTDKHGMIMCIDANEDLWLLEPQSDARCSDLNSWQGTRLRFVII